MRNNYIELLFLINDPEQNKHIQIDKFWFGLYGLLGFMAYQPLWVI